MIKVEEENMNKQLTRSQWEQLDDQMSGTSSESDPDGIPREHRKLIALLNSFGRGMIAFANSITFIIPFY